MDVKLVVWREGQGPLGVNAVIVLASIQLMVGNKLTQDAEMLGTAWAICSDL